MNMMVIYSVMRMTGKSEVVVQLAFIDRRNVVSMSPACLGTNNYSTLFVFLGLSLRTQDRTPLSSVGFRCQN
jgi:hypothetical protein